MRQSRAVTLTHSLAVLIVLFGQAGHFRASAQTNEPKVEKKLPTSESTGSVAPATEGCRPVHDGDGAADGESGAKVRVRLIQPAFVSYLDQNEAGQGETIDLRSDQEIQDELGLVRHRHTPFVTFGSPIRVRAGDAGVDRLVIQDGDAIGSLTLANAVRLTVDARLTNASSGTPDGRSTRVFGTLPVGAKFTEQTQSGYGGEAQLSTNLLGLMLGMTPRGFFVEHFVGGIRLGLEQGPVMLLAVREPMKDSLVSYAGARDPGTGLVWGGVVSDSVSLQLSHNASGDGQYLSARYADLHGQNVANNWGVDGTGGAYWRVVKSGQGGLSVGLNVTGMHYEKNQNFFTLGQGGYFSPQLYALASAPVSWYDRTDRVEYEISAGVGVQHIVEDAAPYYPTIRGLLSQPTYQGQTRTGPNYNLSFRVDYRLAPQVSLIAFATANNARDYAARTIGISLRILTQRLPTGTGLRVRSVPDWRGRQPFSFF